MLWLIGCSVPEHFLEREAWEAFILADNNSAFHLRLSKGNSGLLVDQVHLRAVRYSSHTDPLEYALHGQLVDSDFSESGAQIGSQYISNDNGWSIRIRDSFFNIQASLSPVDPPTIYSLNETPNWQVTVRDGFLLTQGWMNINENALPISGLGIVVHRKGNQKVKTPREVILVSSGEQKMYLERDAEGGQLLLNTDGQYQQLELEASSFGDLVKITDQFSVEFITQRPLGQTDPFEKVSDLERFIVSPIYASPQTYVSTGTALIHQENKEISAQYLRVVHANSPPIFSQDSPK
jgi:hypothetical protein